MANFRKKISLMSFLWICLKLRTSLRTKIPNKKSCFDFVENAFRLCVLLNKRSLIVQFFKKNTQNCGFLRTNEAIFNYNKRNNICEYFVNFLQMYTKKLIKKRTISRKNKIVHLPLIQGCKSRFIFVKKSDKNAQFWIILANYWLKKCTITAFLYTKLRLHLDVI